MFSVRGKLITSASSPLPTVYYTREQTANYWLLISRRIKSGRVIARYRYILTAKTIEVSVGAGEPKKRLAQTYANEALALANAQAEYKRAQRNEQRLELKLVGNPHLVAGGPIQVSGFREGINGQWLINRVEHVISKNGVYSSRLNCQMG
ncbi:hypothetical protein [Marinomonas algicola]|uniref:hypothetical protein n=1 Tax=Marinomonas algicola TaxID=2773454 RepID=UPI00174CE32A|nr:hypothetical protein [Marinomonas algicola]